jgi:hypothetical protein
MAGSTLAFSVWEVFCLRMNCSLSRFRAGSAPGKRITWRFTDNTSILRESIRRLSFHIFIVEPTVQGPLDEAI